MPMCNINKLHIANLLDKMIKEGYTPNEEEIKQLREISGDMEAFVHHWDESEDAKSPFAYINLLNKMASKNFVYEGVDLAKLSLLLKKIHGERYGFTPSILDKDRNGHFVKQHNSIEGTKDLPIDLSLSGYLDAYIDKIFEYYKALQKLDGKL